MSGKSYTMNEMRQIVEYIAERRAYGEVKGRKMWVDFANSKMTNRTWQSLKETFLKRILPDIHNPYYKLTLFQISSFKEGHDVEKKIKNKLEVREADDENILNGNTKNDTLSSSNKKTEVADKGEDHTNSKADRDSTETILLNNCYETAEDIKRDLMTPDDELKDTTKTLRDLIEFEPMTPDVQRLIDDFVSEDEGSDEEPRMQIDLDHKGKNGNAEDEPITLSDTEQTNIEKSNNADIQTEKEQVDKSDKISDNTDNNVPVEKANSSNNEVEKHVTTEAEPNKENIKTVLNNSESITSTHSTMPDSILPNNQEELKEKTNKKSLSLNNNDTNLKLPISNESENKKSPAKRKNENRTNSVSSTNSEKREHRHASKKSKIIADEKVSMIVETPVNISEEAQVSKEDNGQENESAQSQNPCLQSVNLYSETIADSKNSETDDTIKLSKQQAGTSKQPKNDVVILKSHSESGSSLSEPERRRLCLIDSKRYKDKTLANVFGFKSGTVRRRNSHNRKRSISHQRIYDVSSESGDWTSDSVSEYVSPPRGRRNRHTKKYLKPKSSRVRSLEKNGGLFVVYNNRIYPLVKDGKLIKNHLTYASDDESDAERKVWKKKYLEEKKRTEELERLLNRMQEKNRIEERLSEMAVCSSKCNTAKTDQVQCPPQDTINREEAKQEVENKSVKIKFTRNDEEVQLEGPLSHITPALAQVMQLLQKSDLHKASPKPIEPERASTPSVVAVSLDDVHETVNKLESEIFKEIEEQDKNESIADNTTEDQSSDGNVTKRTALRRRALSSTSARSTTKKPRVDKDENAQKKQDKTPPTDKDAVTGTRRTRTPRKVVNEISKTESNVGKRSSRLKPTEMPEKTEMENTQEANDESDIKYKFPSLPPTEKKAQARNTRKSQNKSNSTKTDTVQCNTSYSSESMQGYQDSDVSSPKVIVRIKPTSKTQDKPTHKSVSINYINEETESSNSFPDVKQTITFHNSTLSEAYKSDSYQLLMPINTSKTNEKRSVSVKRDTRLVCKTNETLENEDEQSSSNISPPTSPVLSIVENLSISRSLLTSVDDLQTDEIDQLEYNHITLNKLMKSDQNAPKPLMEQDCRFDSDHNDGVNYHYNIQVKNTNNNTLTPNSQSLVNKLNTINLSDFNVTDSVYVRLEKLMLDSNKKSKSKESNTEKKDNKVNAEENKKPEKGKTKKRSSTPRRKENIRKTKESIKEQTIEEEHVERNSCVSRNSCPAMLQNTETDCTEDANKILEKKPRSSKELKKLNIIKVKITKPKDKMKDRSKTDKASASQIEMNSTKTSSQETDNSIDLIHNHSETCLQAHECVDNSVDIVEKSPSIISVVSEKSDNISLFNIDEFLAQELYSSNARNGIEESPETQLTAECPDLFYTPLGPLSSANSLMTEDLTTDIPEKTPTPSTKWFLLSEDEASTNFVDLNQNLLPKDVGYGANLNDLFPVTCAVPDLSTITEMSKENDADTRSNLNISLPTSKM